MAGMRVFYFSAIIPDANGQRLTGSCGFLPGVATAVLAQGFLQYLLLIAYLTA
jgi:hypothetical protein